MKKAAKERRTTVDARRPRKLAAMANEINKQKTVDTTNPRTLIAVGTSE